MYIFKKKKKIYLTKIFDLIGGAIFFSFSLKRLKLPENVRKILIIRLDGIGDVILSTPVYEALKKKYPSAKLTVLVGSHTKGVVEMNPYVDNVFVLRNTWFTTIRNIKFSEILSMLRKIRKENLDIGIDLRGDMRNILLMFFGKVRYRIGYGITGGGFLLNKMPHYEQKTHEVDKNLKLIEGLDCTVINKKMHIYSSQADEEKILNLLEAGHVRKNGILLAVHMETGYPSKSWRKEKFVQLLQEMSKRDYGKIVLIGKGSDDIDFSYIYDRLKFNYLNTIGKLSIGELAVLLKRCAALISCDSGPVHVATAVETPCIILFSGTNDLTQWGHLNNLNRVIHKDVECSPCERRVCSRDIHLCMDKIRVEDVLSELDKLTEIVENIVK